MRKVIAVIVFIAISVGLLSFFVYLSNNYRPIPFNYKSPQHCTEDGVCDLLFRPPEPAWAAQADALIVFIVSITAATLVSRKVWIGKER